MTIIISPVISKAPASPWREAGEGGWGGRGDRGGTARRRLRRSRFSVLSSYCLKSSAYSLDKYSAHSINKCSAHSIVKYSAQSVDKSSAHSVDKYSAHSDCWIAGKREVEARLQSGRVGGVGVLQQDLRYRCDGNECWLQNPWDVWSIMNIVIVIILCLWVLAKTLLWFWTFRRNDSHPSSDQSFKTRRSILSSSDRFHLLQNLKYFVKYFNYFVK